MQKPYSPTINLTISANLMLLLQHKCAGYSRKPIEVPEKLTAINPAVRPFFCSSQTVVETGICSTISLISHDKSASSTNQAGLFDYILQRENKVKHIALYQEWQFTKLGFAAASLLDSFKYLMMLINESP